MLFFLIYIAYIWVGAWALYVTWRLTSRYKSLPIRLSLWSFVFAVFFCPTQVGITYIPFPRTAYVVLAYLDTSLRPGHTFTEQVPDPMLTIYFIPVAISWLVVFLVAWLGVSLRMKSSDRSTPTEK